MTAQRELAERIADAADGYAKLAGVNLPPMDRDHLTSVISAAVEPLVDAAMNWNSGHSEACKFVLFDCSDCNCGMLRFQNELRRWRNP